MKLIFSILLIFFCTLGISKENIFKTDGGTFDISIYVCVSNNIPKIINLIDSLGGMTVDSLYFDTRATTFYTYGNPIFVWFPDEQIDLTVVNHELVHVVCAIMKWANIPLTNETEEIFAYEFQYLTKQIYRGLLYVR